ncbi:MAG: FtsX-like permease family protein [Acidobacteria bacterium]|nr:FtsX-like permease family protein [Acidobacteriota bacterium]
MRANASFREAFTTAANSLRGSKLRSFLTLLGIILATATLISVMSLIEGMNRYIAENVSNMGADGFRVRRMVMIGHWDPKKFLVAQRRNPELTREEFEFLKSRATLVRELGMEAGRDARLHYRSEVMEGVRLNGVTPNMAVIRNIQPVSGRYITDIENQRRLPVAFLGHDVKQRFFPSVEAVGKTILIEGRPFQVVGVSKELGSVFGNSQDGFVQIPIETYFKMFGSRMGIGYAALARDRLHLERAKDEVRMLLRAWRHLGPNEDDTFGIVASESLVDAWDRMTGAIAMTAIAVVSVFMVVGGIVIMNIMLAVVSERTHEIGVRKAVGARRSDIRRQFLVESSMLAASGGLAGVLLAWLSAVAIRNFTPVPMSLPWSALVMGVGLSAIVGLFFGIYPSTRAARLDPIEALRVER